VDEPVAKNGDYSPKTVAAFDDRLVVHTADKLSPFPASPFSAIIFASVDEA